MPRSAILALLIAAASPALAAPRIASVHDDSTTATLVERDRNVMVLRRALERELVRSHATATIDATIARVTVERRGSDVIVAAQVRIAISDANGKIASVIAGSAQVEIAARSYRARDLPRLGREALVAAIGGVTPKVHATLATMVPARQPRVADRS